MADVWVQVVIGLVKGFVFTYDLLAYLPYYLYYSLRQGLSTSNRVKAKRLVPEDPGSPYRAVENLDRLLTSPFTDCFTLDEYFNQAVERFGPKACLGTRELLSEEDERQPSGKIFRKAVLGDYQWLTYEQVNKRINAFGYGLLVLGQEQKSNICIFAETRADWIVAALSCFRFCFPVITLYSTLGDEAIVHGINETEVSFVITSADLLPKFKGLACSLPTLRHLIYMDQNKGASVGGFPASVFVHSMSHVEEIGARPESLKAVTYKAQPSDIAVIMYTSGSTGMPKGVMISHSNALSAMAGMGARVPVIGPDDLYIGYLPLAHILELDAELIALGFGVPIGFSSPNTLTDQSTRIKKGCKGDTSVLRPTIITAVPVILDRIRKGVLDKMAERSPLQFALFNYFFEYKRKHYEAGYDTPFVDRLIFAKAKAMLGGRIRLILSGGAPLSPDTQRFMNICFCCPIGQGYGLTETTGAGTLHEVTDRSTGRVGAPVGCSEFVLVDWEEGGYTTRDKPNPRGEVWVAGGNVAVGYYKNARQTGEDFHEIDGKRWFATGDIGEFHEDGCLAIIDRKKDLVKLQGGEYVALGWIEAVVKLCPLVDNVCVCASANESYIICLVLPNQRHLKALADSLGVGYTDWLQLCDHPNIKSQVLKAIEEQCVKAKLQKAEIPQKLKLCTEAWTPDSGLVTESYKLKRKSLEMYYAADIERMYK